MASKWRTTIGYERNFNPALQIPDKSAFIKSLTEKMPPSPDHFSRCSDINRKGPVLLSDLPEMQALSPKQFMEKMARGNTVVLDARSYHAFAGQNLAGSWHLDPGGNFPTFAGWVMPTDKDILLIADDHKKAREADIWARRVGVDRIIGYLDGGMTAWAVSGLGSSHIELISPEDLHDMISGGSDLLLLDVRANLEFAENHIEGSVNIPVSDLRTRYRELDENRTTVVICSSGNRSSLGASILRQHGFKKVINVAGGMTGYSAAGYIRECRACVNPHGSRFFAGFGELPNHWKRS